MDMPYIMYMENRIELHCIFAFIGSSVEFLTGSAQETMKVQSFDSKSISIRVIENRRVRLRRLCKTYYI